MVETLKKNSYVHKIYCTDYKGIRQKPQKEKKSLQSITRKPFAALIYTRNNMDAYVKLMKKNIVLQKHTSMFTTYCHNENERKSRYATFDFSTHIFQ